MYKHQHLIAQYERIMATGDFVVEQWRTSCERFIADMWDRTPTKAGQRRLEPIDPDLGFSPDNVEWCYPTVRARPVKGQRVAKVAPKARSVQKLRPTKAERKAADAAAKEAKRKVIAEEFARWEDIRRGVKS
jgi:hypothetical protein